MASPDIFLSYAREDQATARRFAQALEAEGLSVWWDQTLSAGEAFDRVTEKALKAARAVVVLWSPHSVESNWVRAEAAEADESHKLVPVLIEPCSVPIKFKLTQTADLSGWKGGAQDPAWRQFAAGLAQYVGDRGGGTQPAVSAASGRPAASRRLAPVLAIAAAVLAAVAAGAWWMGRSTQPGGETQQASVAVLPFVNLSGDPEQEYFSDGLTEEILNELAQIPELRVTGRTSSFAYKGKNEDLRGIARALDVANILEGSIRRDGQSLRVTAQLIDGQDGSHRWSNTYDRQLIDIFAVQTELAVDVARALSVKLQVNDVSREKGGTTNVEAYDLWLHARDFFNAGNPQQGAPLTREAVRLDPKFSLGWSQLYYMVGAVPPASPEHALARRAETDLAARKVLELTPDTWFGKLMQANLHADKHEWGPAMAAAEAAVADGPTNAANFQRENTYPQYARVVGRYRDAARHLRLAIALDPNAVSFSANLQRTLQDMGDFAGVEEEYQRTRALSEGTGAIQFLKLMRMLVHEGADQAALNAQWQRVAGTNRSMTRDAVAKAIIDPPGALAILRAGIDTPAVQTANAQYGIASLADALGDKDLALKALRRLVDDYGQLNVWILHSAGVRSDPRFKQILRDLKVVDYWRESGNWGDFCKPVRDDDFECH